MYIYINFKAINNVLDAKMVLKHISLIRQFTDVLLVFVNYVYNWKI